MVLKFTVVSQLSSGGRLRRSLTLKSWEADDEDYLNYKRTERTTLRNENKNSVGIKSMC